MSGAGPSLELVKLSSVVPFWPGHRAFHDTKQKIGHFLERSFIVKDGQRLALGCLNFEDEPQQQMSMKRLLRDEAFLIAVTIAMLPSGRVLATTIGSD